MAKRNRRKVRDVRLDYVFDRLLLAKLQQAYEILVPDRFRTARDPSILIGDEHENCGDLRSGFLGEAEGRAHHCQSDRRLDRVRRESGL